MTRSDLKISKRESSKELPKERLRSERKTMQTTGREQIGMRKPSQGVKDDYDE